MRALLAFGDITEGVKREINGLDDSVDIRAYTRAYDLIENITILRLNFDRIVLTHAGVKSQQELIDLNKFLRKEHPRATVVFMFPKGKENAEKKAKFFNEVFNSPLYTDLAVEEQNLSILLKSVRGGIDEIREQYSANKQDEIDDDLLEDDYDEEENEESGEATRELEIQPMVVLPQRKRQHKRYGFFGIKKLSKVQLQTKQQNMQIIMAYMQHLKGDTNIQEESYEQDIHSKVLQEGYNHDEVNQTSDDNVYNVNEKSKELSEKLSNLTPSRTFTELEFGFYNFINTYDGRPMVSQEGSGYKQLYK
ncbi:hypothetical protein [Bacillus toyonensis]|uniref:hypothetical protein n=1 Tax=Bacillus toyonensis TaxID=155322 RepID=UPI000BF5988C|nr:hypothetical protein [Bacillus toyonensis]PGF05112.1 hypothetical protein COM61_01410 [Bacillus toyonensis]